MNVRIVAPACAIALAITAPAQAQWVLLGVDVHMGAVAIRDIARDLDVRPAAEEGIPTFHDRAACEKDMHRAMHKYDGLSHAEGNFGRFLCTNLDAWQTSPTAWGPPPAKTKQAPTAPVSSTEAEERAKSTAAPAASFSGCPWGKEDRIR